MSRLRVSGPQAWPDHVLDYSVGHLLVGLALQVRGFVLGFEAHAKRGWNPWLAVYIGLWAFEFYWDADGSFAPEEPDA